MTASTATLGEKALELLTHLGAEAMAVLALGTCAAYGGIPAALPNVTGCKGVKEIFADEGIATPVINLPGCPTHPDWFVGTVASVLIGGLGAVEVDHVGRPLAFYEPFIHDNFRVRLPVLLWLVSITWLKIGIGAIAATAIGIAAHLILTKTGKRLPKEEKRGKWGKLSSTW